MGTDIYNHHGCQSSLILSFDSSVKSHHCSLRGIAWRTWRSRSTSRECLAPSFWLMVRLPPLYPMVVAFCCWLSTNSRTVSKSLHISHANSGHSDIVLIPQPTECGSDPLVRARAYPASHRHLYILTDSPD